MTEPTTLVKPWPGLILAGIPPQGAEIPTALADEWIANHLVVAVPQPPHQEPSTRPSTKRRSSK